MSELERLQSENRRLRNENALLELHCADLESKLDAAVESIAELEGEETDDDRPLVWGDEEQVYYASKNRKKFHRPSCKFAECLLTSPNLLEFSSHREAREAGYKPCGQCRA